MGSDIGVYVQGEPGGAWFGRLTDLTTIEIQAALPNEAAFPFNGTVQVRIGSAGVGSSDTVEACVQHRNDEGSQQRYGFRHCLRAEQIATMPASLRAIFDRRLTRRFPMPKDCTAYLSTLAGSAMSTGRLVDVSLKGCGVQLPGLPSGEPFFETKQLRVTFRLPQESQPFALPAHVRRRSVTGNRFFYGLEFSSGGGAALQRLTEVLERASNGLD